MIRRELLSLAGEVRALAADAGRIILEIYQTAFEVEYKSDNSPLTAADRASHEVIMRGLELLTPGIPVWSEESPEMTLAGRSKWAEFWLVDPLDGTREFVKRNGEFTVNVALVSGHRPVLGVIHVPVDDTQYFGGEGLGSFAGTGRGEAGRIEVCRLATDPIRVAGSRSHGGDSLAVFLMSLPGHQFISAGSSIKFCLIASGKADVYPRLGPTSEWDTAAGQAIVEGAGGVVADLRGQPLTYNSRPEPVNPFFVAFGDPSRHWPSRLARVSDTASGRAG
jgi:3'(2'), 5'-bisphosphate nucleotidase